MWADFLDTDDAKLWSTGSHERGHGELASHGITIVKSAADVEPSENSELYDNSDDDNDEDEPEVWCGRCGKMVQYETLAEHDEDTSHMTLIRPRLYVGGMWNANNPDEIRINNIGTIVCTAEELPGKRFANSGIRYKMFSLVDDDREFALTTFIHSTAFLENEFKQHDKSIFVHCFMGRSRSVATIVAYLLYSEKLTTLGALNRVQALHKTARPNDGYMKQLLTLEILFKHLSLDILILVADFLPQHGLNR